jgi:hypothetical protein
MSNAALRTGGGSLNAAFRMLEALSSGLFDFEK